MGIRLRLYRLSLPCLKSATKLLNLTLIESLRSYVNHSSLQAGLFLIMLVFIGATVSTFLGAAFAELFLGIPLFSEKELMEDLTNPDLAPALRLLGIIQPIGLFVFPAVFYLWVSKSKEALKTMFQAPVRQPVLISIAFFMLALPLVNYLSEWNSNWNIPTFIGEWMVGKEEQAGKLTESFLDMPNVGFLLFNLIMIGLLPAVGEELIFRGIMQRGILKKVRNPHVAIWIAAIIFSAVHFQFLGFVPRMLMGVAMGYLFYWSGNLWYPIIAHFTNNAGAVLLNYGSQHSLINPGIEDAGIGNPTIACFSLVFCMMLLYLFKQHQEVGFGSIKKEP